MSNMESIVDKGKMTGNTLRVESCPSHCTTPSDRNEHQAVPVKVGCLHINPTTKRGRRVFMVQMLALCFVPHAALVAQNCSVMAQLSQTMDASLYLHSEVSSSLSVGEAIATIQEERYVVTKALISGAPPTMDDRWELERAFQATDGLFAELPDNTLKEHDKGVLYRFREDFVHNVGLKKADSRQRMSIYGEINSVLLIYLGQQVKLTTSTLWRQLSACYDILKAMEELSLAQMAMTLGNSKVLGRNGTVNVDKYYSSAVDHLESTLLYLNVEKMDEGKMLKDLIEFYKEASSLRDRELEAKGSGEGNYFMLETESRLRKLGEIRMSIWSTVRKSVIHEVWVARRTLAVGVIILTTVLLASPILVLLISHTVNTIQRFNHSVEVSTQQLVAEKQKSDLLLSRMLPVPVLRRLRAQRTVPAEAFDAVTIFFSDIVGFTTISASSTPMEVINMLNMLYRLFDEKITQYNVYKVETIGDAYMVVSGLPQRNGNKHASEIADMSLSLMRCLDGARVPHRPEEALRIRAGVNTGPCVAGVVGATMPRYCLFGDTINVASRMESTGEAMKIHISYSTKKALDLIGGYEMHSRGLTDVAGKGQMETFWLIGKIGGIQAESPRCLRLNDYDQNLLELLIKA